VTVRTFPYPERKILLNAVTQHYVCLFASALLFGCSYSVNGELCSTKKPSAITFVEDDKKLRIKVSSETEFTVWCYL